MGKKLRNFLIALVASLGLVILVFSNQTTSTEAATYTTSQGSDGFLTGMSIKQKDHGTASNVEVTLNWDTTGTQLNNGDTWEIQLPPTLKVREPGDKFDLTNDNGEKIGEAILNSDNTILITFTDVEGKTDFNGSLNLTSGLGVGKDAVVGQNDVQIGNQHDNMTVVTSDSDFSKKGTMGKDADGNPIITWTILANRNSGDFPNLLVKDLNITDGTQTYIPGSVNVYESSWSSPGYYKKDRLLDSSEYKSFYEDGNGFSVGLPQNNQFYAITFQTRIDDPANASNGNKFRNNAEYTWGNTGGNGTNSGNVSASVVGNSNSGSGNGNNILGSVLLTKTSTEDGETPLQGAVYDIYEYGSDTPVKQGLTTDTNGQINVSGLPAGNYYFKETTPPDGYEANGNEVPFTISGTTTTTVKVNTQDEPISDNPEGSIVIMKIDKETGYRLTGAEFEILDKDGNSVGTITVDELGIDHYYNLPYGDYTLHEIKTPSGYISGKDISFTIDKENPTPSMIIIENEKITGSDDTYMVSLQKFDREDMTIGVPDAEYSLYSEDGTFITKNVTDKDGMITVEGLKPGKYYFLETKAPDGYDLNPDKIEFEITDDYDGIGLGTLETSDPKTTSGNEGNGNTEEPGTDVDGNNNEDKDGNEEDNNGGIIVDPENPGSNNNNNNGDGGLITNPINPGNSNNGSTGSSNSNGTLPQTGAKSGLIASLLGLVLLSGVVYYKRRNA